jgi:predicted dehydrogenase
VQVTAELETALADPGVTGVVVATPAKTHYAIAMQALQAGRDVLVEKPMTLSVAEAADLVDFAAKKERVLMVGHLLLYRPSICKLCEIVKSGRIGNVFKVEMRRRKLGKVRVHENVLWSFGPHDVAVLLAMIEREVTRVWSVGSAFLQQKVEDEASMHLSFGDSVKAELHFSWLWPIDERKCIVVGSQGMITYDEITDSILVYDKRVNGDLTVHSGDFEKISVETTDALETQDQHFLDCIKTRQRPRTDGQQGVDVVRCLTGAMKNIEREVFCENGLFRA